MARLELTNDVLDQLLKKLGPIKVLVRLGKWDEQMVGLEDLIKEIKELRGQLERIGRDTHEQEKSQAW